MIKLEETCRELKQKLKAKNASSQEDNQSILLTSPSQIAGMDDTKFEELQRANKILLRSKEAQYKKGQYLKAKFEKKLEKLQTQVQAF